jgi:hypothetical protein
MIPQLGATATILLGLSIVITACGGTSASSQSTPTAAYIAQVVTWVAAGGAENLQAIQTDLNDVQTANTQESCVQLVGASTSLATNTQKVLDIPARLPADIQTPLTSGMQRLHAAGLSFIHACGTGDTPDQTVLQQGVQEMTAGVADLETTKTRLDAIQAGLKSAFATPTN